MYAKIKFKSIKESFLCGATKLGIILYVFIQFDYRQDLLEPN